MRPALERLRGERFPLEAKIGLMTVVSSLLLMVDYYHAITPYNYWDRFLLYLGVPLFCIVVLFREHPRDYGVTLGDWKAGLLLTGVGIALMAPILFYLGSHDPAFKSYYEWQSSDLPWSTFLDLVGWEFMFRGWLLFGYTRRFGSAGLWLQSVPFALAHLGKPELEAVATVFGGLLFGWVGWRTRSFLWPFLIHWFITTFLIAVAAR